MDFFKFFDWPRKINVDPIPGKQGNIAIAGILSQTLPTINQYLNMAVLSLACSGRPVQIHFQTQQMNPNGGIIFPNGLSGNQNIIVGVQIVRNGVVLATKELRTQNINWTAIGIMGVSLSQFDYVDFSAPAGNNNYQINFLCSTARSYDVIGTDVLAWEM